MAHIRKNVHDVGQGNIQALSRLGTKLDTIATNTANINVNVGDVEINVADLEVLQAQTNTTLASILVDTDAADSSLNTIEAQSVLTASRLNNIQNKISANVDGTGDTLGQISSNILTKNGEIESSMNSLISANHTDLVALESSLTSMEGKLDVIDTVLDASLIKQGEIETTNNANQVLITATNSLLTTADAVLDASLVKQTNIESLITTLDTVQDNALTKLGEIETTNNANQVLLTGVAGLITTSNNGLSEIDSGISDLDTLLTDIEGGVLTDNNTKLDHLSGDLDTLNGKIDTLTTRIKLANSDAHLAVSLEDIGGVSTQTTTASILAKNTEIETSLNSIQSAVEGTLTVGSHAVTNAGTFAVQVSSALPALPAGDNNIGNVDIASAIPAGDNNIGNVDIASAIPAGNNNIGNVDIASALPAGTNAIGKLSANSGVDIGDVDVTSISAGTNRIGMIGMKANESVDGTGTERFVLCDAAGHLQVDVLSGGGSTDVSALSTHAKQDTIIGHLDGVEGKLDHLSDNIDTLDAVQDNALTKLGEIETSLDALISANHTDLVALEATLTEIAPRQATAGVYSNASLADDGVSTVIDTDDYSFMTICASQGSADLPLEVQYSINNSNWFKVRSKLIEFASYEGGSWADIILERPMRYVRFVNTSGSTITTLYLSYQLSN